MYFLLLGLMQAGLTVSCEEKSFNWLLTAGTLSTPLMQGDSRDMTAQISPRLSVRLWFLKTAPRLSEAERLDPIFFTAVGLVEGKKLYVLLTNVGFTHVSNTQIR